MRAFCKTHAIFWQALKNRMSFVKNLVQQEPWPPSAQKIQNTCLNRLISDVTEPWYIPEGSMPFCFQLVPM